MNRSKNCVGQTINGVLIINQFLGKNNRTYVSYICQSCNTEHSTMLVNVKNARVKGKCRKKPYGEASFNNLFNTYKQNARLGGCGEPNKEFVLSKEDARKLFKGTCFYCGKPPSQIFHHKKYNGEFVYNGIDRKDNVKGYSIENCVSCCSFCNYTKNNTPFNDFIKWIRTVDETTKNVKMI